MLDNICRRRNRSLLLKSASNPHLQRSHFLHRRSCRDFRANQRQNRQIPREFFDFAVIALSQQRFEEFFDGFVEVSLRFRRSFVPSEQRSGRLGSLLRDFPADPLERRLCAVAEFLFRGDGWNIAQIDLGEGGKESKRGLRGGVRGSARRTRRPRSSLTSTTPFSPST